MSWHALVAVIFWGASFVAGKIALRELSPLHLVLVRAILAALALDLFLLWRGGWGDVAHLTRRDWVRIGLLALVSVFPHQLAQMTGLRQTTAINSALLITLSPLFIFGLSAVFFGERVTLLKTGGFLIAILGSALVITRGNLQSLRVGQSTLAGDLLVVVSALGWALYSSLSKSLLLKRSPVLVAALVFSMSVPVLAASALSGEELMAALPRVTWRGWGAMLFLAWACSALGYILWYRALQKQEMSRVSVLQYLQPLVATLLSIVLLNESVAWATAIGGGLILGGVALVNRKQ